MTNSTLSNRLDALLFQALLDPDRSAALCALIGASTETPHLDDEALAGVLEATPSLRSLAHAVRCIECQRALQAVDEAISVVPLPRNLPVSALPAAQPRALFARVAIVEGEPLLLGGSGHHRVSASLSTRNQGLVSSGLTMRDHAEAPLWQVTVSTVDEGARWSVDTKWLGAEPPDTICVTQGDRLVAAVPVRDARATVSRLRPIDTRIAFVHDEHPVAVTWIAVEAE